MTDISSLWISCTTAPKSGSASALKLAQFCGDSGAGGRMSRIREAAGTCQSHPAVMQGCAERQA